MSDTTVVRITVNRTVIKATQNSVTTVLVQPRRTVVSVSARGIQGPTGGVGNIDGATIDGGNF